MRRSIETRVVALAMLTSACGASGGGSFDASTNADADADAAPVTSRCVVTSERITCEHTVTSFAAGADARDVYWETPVAPPPASGYPVVVLYQGSLFPPSSTWDVTPAVPFGGFQQGRLQAMLLEHGFTVVAPTAAAGLAWQTNAGVPFETTSDAPYVTALVAAIHGGAFGPADPSRMYAAGISSGGYMTSRMAVSYAGVFRALAIASGSYATCVGPVCSVPTDLPADHPPTLFLHGTVDTIVPIATMRPYHDRLEQMSIATAVDEDPSAGHQWLADSPEQVTSWFEVH